MNIILNLYSQFTGCFLLLNYPLNLLQFNIGTHWNVTNINSKLLISDLNIQTIHRKKSHSIRYQNILLFINNANIFCWCFISTYSFKQKTLNKNIYIVYMKNKKKTWNNRNNFVGFSFSQKKEQKFKPKQSWIIKEWKNELQ